ncbi:unnamed protein product [Staurois parvus]|uniref:Uncharacterized protein n=1 Tax=Staurois parvus TaxID=386267 RepID=A0ABN9D2I2_9NEOB|nr:unnamed protein product [Staurois parvus]
MHRIHDEIADLWGAEGGGEERVPEFDRYQLPLLRSCLPSPPSGTGAMSQKTAEPFTKHSASCFMCSGHPAVKPQAVTVGCPH